MANCSNCGSKLSFFRSNILGDGDLCAKCINELSQKEFRAIDEKLSEKRSAEYVQFFQSYKEMHASTFSVDDGPLLAVASGYNGDIELYEKKIRIRRGSVMSLISVGLAGSKDIWIEQISSIQIRKPAMGTNGYIQFSFFGGHEGNSGLLHAAGNENAVLFDSSQEHLFIKIKQLIEERIAIIKQPKTLDSGNISDIEKLFELKKQGIITEEEFQLTKRKILGI